MERKTRLYRATFTLSGDDTARADVLHRLTALLAGASGSWHVGELVDGDPGGDVVTLTEGVADGDA